MSNLTTPQIYALNRKAGFNPAQAVIATAIALAESAGNPSAIGDINNPGPGAKSVGLFQINYLPGRDAKTPWRNPTANLDPTANAQNAFIISKSGKNFSPWATYNSGAYKKYLPQAQAAAGIDSIKSPSLLDTWKSGTGTISTTVTKAVGRLNPLNGVSKVVTEGLFILAALGLIVLGATRATGTGAILPAPEKVKTL